MSLLSWVLIVVLILLVVMVMKVRHFKHRAFAVIFILLLVFIYITSMNVLSGYDINLKTFTGIEKAVKVYFVWLGGVFDNMKSLTGNAVKLDWGMKNKTEADKIAGKG